MLTLNKIEEIGNQFKSEMELISRRIIVCAGTGCVANGSKKVLHEFEKQLKEKNLDVLGKLEFSHKKDNSILISKSGCQGFCQMGPLVTIEPDGILYTKVQAEDVSEIVEESLINNNLVERLLYKDPFKQESHKGADDISFYKRQNRFVLKNCGSIDPESIEEYFSKGGYIGAYKAIKEMTQEEVCNEVSFSGLRGRGGGGFPTGLKWEMARKENNEIKYIVCNGDEGDPGAFMDRSIMEGNPHAVIEGMMIAAKAIGAQKGYAYVRMEYPLAVERFRNAVITSREIGILGKNIFGTDFEFDVEVMEGAGAFVCGEETALIASIQGERGMPKPKPPFPSQSGLWGKPTIINNVETLAAVSLILQKGAKSFKEIGTPNSPGTKTFALTGHVANTGLIEVPFGTTLREIIFNIGGGIIDDNNEILTDGFKAVQIGGPSGGCLTQDHLDLPLDFDSLKSIGAMIGSGGLVAMNKNTCMIKIAKFFMQFTQNESCGKCVLCREGTKQMLVLLDDISEGRATIETIDLLEDLAHAVQKGSLCGLGKTAPSPVLSTLNQFREEYMAHVLHQRCPAKQCEALLTPHVIEEKCKGCGLCIKACPVGAITGEKKQPHYINEALCIKCGACLEKCRLEAIEYGA